MVDSNKLYVALGSDGVSIYNIDDLSSPELLDTYNTSSLANRLSPFMDKVAVSDWDDVEILDWNGNNLNLVGYKNTTNRTMAIATKDNYIFSAEWAAIQSMEFGVVSGPDLDLSSTYIIYPYVENGNSFSMYIEAINNGGQILSILDNYTTNPEFEVINPLNELLPGEGQLVELVYNASNSNASGSYRIFSNDIDQSQIICSLVGNVDGANIGESAPNFNLEIVANGTGYFQLSDYLGTVVVLAFFAPNRPVCSPELSDMETLIWQSYPQNEVIVLGIINTSNQGMINTFVEENSISFPIVYDPGSSGGVQGGDTYDLYYLPNNGSPYPRDFIIDQEGIFKYTNNEIDTELMLYVLNELVGDSCSGWNIGDVNNDNLINVLDIVAIINFILDINQPDDCSSFVSDLNNDQLINVLDIIQLVNIILE